MNKQQVIQMHTDYNNVTLTLTLIKVLFNHRDMWDASI